MISPIRSETSAPCGCGGAHGSQSTSGCGCGCGKADCRDGAIVRPRFFAGQLLTEEDLQALAEYVGAKSRLHNRSFFGEGVTCGFEVVCHPCGGGKVIVRPGHALDCCGNDVVLTAPQTLDVNTLARDLRKRLQGGIDCGDPCADPSKGEPRAHYCLFVNYCESLTDPVSAFVTDEPCGTAACEPTRVREGLRFELRCREKADPSQDALCRIANCLGEPEQLGKVIADLTVVDHMIQQLEEALHIKGEKEKKYDATKMVASADALDKAIAAAVQTPSGETFRKVMAGVASVTVHLARYNNLGRPLPPPDEIKVKTGDALDQVKTKILPTILTVGNPTDLEKSFFRTVMEDAELAINTATGSQPQRDLWTDDNVPKLGSQLDQKLCDLSQSLRAHLHDTPDVAACQLHSEVRDLERSLCPAPTSSRVLPDVAEPAQRLRDAWWHFLQECICPALLPPCPECHDPGVLLACLEVEKCEVVKICNLDRIQVPTPVAVRHWLPLRSLQRLAAALCCRDLGALELKKLLDSLCPSTTDLTTLVSVFLQLRDLVLAHEPLAPPSSPGLPLPASPAPTPTAAALSAPAEAAEPAAVRRLEAAHKKSAAELEQAQSDLETLRRELGEQTEKNADLEKRLKALEGRKKP